MYSMVVCMGDVPIIWKGHRIPSFIHKWAKDYVPAVIEYGNSSKKNIIRNLMKDLLINDEG